MEELGAQRCDRSAVHDRVLAVASYTIVALVCLARLDGVFTFRDLTSTDTELYYRAASTWLGNGLVTVDRAPLYGVLLGVARWIIDDATIVVPAHRLIAALALALAGLALFRRLFPAPIAILLATWAAIVPTQFDGLYEVHLIGAAACAITAWAATYGERRGARGLVLGLLLIFSLIRSELLAAAVAWSIACALYECRVWRSNQARASLGRVLLPYMVPPLALVVVLVLGFAAGAWAPRFRATPKIARHFCNAYALGVAEREGLRRRAAWQACKDILRRDFGRADVGPAGALMASPRAVLGHVAWNVRLLPATLELLLWGATGAAEGSDYIPVPTGSRAARAASLMLVALLIAGSVRARPPIDPRFAARRCWAFVGLGALLATSLGILIASRARAPYLAPVGIAMFALVGKMLEAHWPGARSRRTELAVVGFILCAVPFVPPRYDAGYQTRGDALNRPPEPEVTGQPTVIAVRRLTPSRGELASESVRLAAALRPDALCCYLGSGTGTCAGVRVGALPSTDEPSVLDRGLRKLGTTHFYVDERTPGRAAKGLESAALGWTRVAPADRREPWVLLRSEPSSLR